MTIRTTGLGGTNFTSESAASADLNDTINAIKKTRVLDVIQTPTAYDNTNVLTLSKSVDISLNHAANSAYRILLQCTFSGLTGNGQIRIRIKDGANNTDVLFDFDDGSANGTLYSAIEIFPVSTTTVAVFADLLRDAQAPGTSSRRASTATLASAGIWANQDTIEIYYSGNGGTGFRIDGASIQHLAG